MPEGLQKRLNRRRFVTLTGGALLASGILAACGDNTATTVPAATTAAATTAASATTSAVTTAAATTAAGTTAASATTAAGTTAAATSAAAGTTAAAATTAAVKQNLTLSLLASQGWVSDAEQALGKKLEDQTGIHIDYQIIPSDQYFSVLQTKLNSGQGPDIFMGQTGAGQLVTDYNVEKNAVDLSNEAWIKNEDPLSVNESTVNGKVYGQTIVDIQGGWVVVYNKNIFKQLGLSVPKTYSEFKDICQKILAANITPIYEPVADGWHHVLWFPEQGARWEELNPGLKDMLNNNKTTFAATKDAMTTLQQLQEMYTSNFFGANTLADTNDQATAKLANGTYAMYMGNMSTPKSVEHDFPNVKADTFGFFPDPLNDNQVVAINPGGPTRFVYSGSKNIAAAKQYLSFIAQPENLQYRLDNDPNVSSLNFNGVGNKFDTDQKNFFAAYTKRGVVYQAAVKYVNAQWGDMGKDIVASWSGSIQPLDILKKVDQRRATSAKTANDPAWK